MTETDSTANRLIFAILYSVCLGVEGTNRVTYVFDVFTGKFRMDRKRQRILREIFANGEVAVLVSERCETRLQMERQRIVDLGSNPVLSQEGLQQVALRTSD